MSDKLHLILGAGPCGLAAAKALKAHNIPYVQVEADHEVGGNWLHGVYPTAHIISSKSITEYPDYPMPADYPDFPSAAQMCAYYQNYARDHGLYEHLRFHTTVTSIAPVADNAWRVGFADGSTEDFAGVVLCNGHHWDANWPEIPGTFNGEYIHSKYYKDPQQLMHKTTVVIGAGNSACDLASESARLGSETYLAMRSGIYFIPKTIGGKPSADSPMAKWPLWLQRPMVKWTLKFMQGDYEKDYGLKRPDHNLFEKHPTVNDEVLYYIKHGRIQPMANVTRFDGDEVVFEDGRRVRADLVVAATGYHLSYPFLPDALQRVDGHYVRSLGEAVLPDYRGIYFMGWQQFRGGVGQVFTPLAELTAQYILLQKTLDVPVGAYLQHRGTKAPTTHLRDPYELIASARKFQKIALRETGRAQRFARVRGPLDNEPLAATVAREMVLY